MSNNNFLIPAHNHIHSVYIKTDNLPNSYKQILRVTCPFETKHYLKENSHVTKDCQKGPIISESPMTGPRDAETRPQFCRSAKNNKQCFLTTSVGTSGLRAGAGGLVGCRGRWPLYPFRCKTPLYSQSTDH